MYYLKDVYREVHLVYIPMERKIVLENMSPCAILERVTEANMTTLLSHEATVDDQIEHTAILDLKLITILDETESPVVVIKSKCGLMTIGRIQEAEPTRGILSKQGIHKQWTKVPLCILVTNFSKRLLYSISTCVLDCVQDPLIFIVQPEQNDEFKPTVTVTDYTRSE